LRGSIQLPSVLLDIRSFLQSMQRFSLHRLLLGYLGMYLSCIRIGFLLIEPSTNTDPILTDTPDCHWPMRRLPRQNDTQQIPSVTIVISHCNHRLDWVEEFIKDVNSIKNILIYSKCGQNVIGLPAHNSSDSTIIDDVPIEIRRVKNRGRNDHTYLYHILRTLRHEGNHTINPIDDDQDNEYVVFLKDNRETANDLGAQWRSLVDMIAIQQFHHFACGLDYRFFNKLFYVSQFHYQLYLFQFNLTKHDIHESRYSNLSTKPSNIPFKSRFVSLRNWFRKLRIRFPQVYIPVCYGGSFMTSMASIRKVNADKWEQMLRLLSRGNNIEEGHYMERTWAALLSKPMSPCVREKIVASTRAIVRNGPKIGGLLVDLNPTLVKQYILL
jgi:hypothetical protein